MIENRKNYRLNVDKIKTLKDVRNVFDNLHLLGYYDADDPNDENYYLSEYFTIPQEQHGLTFSTPRKSIEELKQEFDEKIDAIIKTTKEKFEYSKIVSEKKYNYEFDKINERFEYAKDNGHFPPTLTIGTLSGSYLLSSGSGDLNWTSNFVIKPTPLGIGSGYWDIKPNIQVWLKEKPNWIVRKCTKIFFDFDWKDV